MIPPSDAAISGGTAAQLRRLAQRDEGDRLTVGDLLDTLGDQGFGLMILLLALPNAVPGPLIPGFSLPFALGIAALGLQLAMGFHAPLLPRFLKRLSMRQERFRRFVKRIEPMLLKFELWVRPRASALTSGPGERLVGVALIALALVMALPVPFGNVPVAFSIMVVALGLLEGDGTALVVGIAGGIAAVLWNGVVVFAGATLVAAAARIF